MGNEDMKFTETYKEIKKIQFALSQLTSREKRIVSSRLGIHISKPKTLEDAGKKNGIGRERVRQIEEKFIEEYENLD